MVYPYTEILFKQKGADNTCYNMAKTVLTKISQPQNEHMLFSHYIYIKYWA